MDNNKCSYTLIKEILGKRLLFITMFIVGVSLTLMPLTMIPNQVNAAPQLITQLTSCSTIDGKSNGECHQKVVKKDGEYDNCYTGTTTPAANNCKTSQTVKVSDNLRDSESEAKINQELYSLVDCD